MDAERMMDSLLSRGRVGPGDAVALAGALAEFYASARRGPEVDQFGRPAAVAMNSEENFRQTENYRGVSVSSARWRFIRDYSQGFLEDNRAFFLRRVEQGRIVDGHGDLHSGNINLPAGAPPLIFDCIEFNQRFRFQDAACDLAFLAMDLEFQGREDLARVLVETYASLSGDRDLPRVLNFYKCYRAVVRAKVHGFELDDPGLPGEQKFTDLGKARAYFRLAARYAGTEPPFFMVCFMGLMGTGKTYLGRELCRRTGWPHLQSDRVRKQMAGLAPKDANRDPWGRGLYSPQRTDETYQALWEGARARLAQGGDVVVDASFNREDRRLRFLDLAQEFGAQALLVQVTAEPEVAAARLARRSRGASISAGRPEIRERQARDWRGFSDRTEKHVLRIDGGKPLEEKMNIIEGKLKELGRGR
jgi:predicted kinase